MQKIIYDNYIIDSKGFLFSKITNKKIGSYDYKNNRYYVKLRLNGKRKTLNIASLVAENFIKNYNPKTDKIIFKDNDFRNCSLENIQIKSYKDLDPKLEKIFNDSDPYKLVKTFYRQYPVSTNNVITYDDIIQMSVTRLYKSMFNYENYLNVPFGAYAFMVLKPFRNSMIKEIFKTNTIGRITNTFDLPLFVSVKDLGYDYQISYQ